MDTSFQFHKAQYASKLLDAKGRRETTKLAARRIEEISVDDVPDMSQASMAKILSISELNTNRNMS